MQLLPWEMQELLWAYAYKGTAANETFARHNTRKKKPSAATSKGKISERQ